MHIKYQFHMPLRTFINVIIRNNIYVNHIILGKGSINFVQKIY